MPAFLTFFATHVAAGLVIAAPGVVLWLGMQRRLHEQRSGRSLRNTRGGGGRVSTATSALRVEAAMWQPDGPAPAVSCASILRKSVTPHLLLALLNRRIGRD